MKMMMLVLKCMQFHGHIIQYCGGPPSNTIIVLPTSGRLDGLVKGGHRRPEMMGFNHGQ